MIKVDEDDPVGEVELSFPYRDVKIRRGEDPKDFYTLDDEVGRGKFGTVYKCVEKTTGMKLAAKFVACPKKEDKRNVEREIDIMRTLQHPRLLQIYDAFENGKIMTVILELIEGGELFERIIDDDFILTEKSCTVFMRQILEGVEFMHKQKILHLDMKPENILCLTKTGNRIKIIDFGLARKFDPDKKLQVLFGTPEFVAPEVVNFEAIGYGTDMWSVGVICYVLLSGLSPFMGHTDIETMANVTVAKYDFDDEAFDEISENAKDFIRKLLIKDMTKRPTPQECLDHPWLKRKPALSKTPSMDVTKDNLRQFVERWNEHPNSPYVFEISTFGNPPSLTSDGHSYSNSSESLLAESPSPCESLASFHEGEMEDAVKNLLPPPVDHLRRASESSAFAIMSGFKRSPSKFSWDSEFLELRDTCASPGSQDSGFSDTEIHSNFHNRRSKNNIKTNARLVKSDTKPKKQCSVEVNFYSEPTERRRCDTRSEKVSKKLFNEVSKELEEPNTNKDSEKVNKKLFNDENRKTMYYLELSRKFRFFSPKPTRRYFKRDNCPPFYRHTFCSKTSSPKKAHETDFQSLSDPNPVQVEKYDEETPSKGEETSERKNEESFSDSEVIGRTSDGESDFGSDIETEFERNFDHKPRHTSTPKWEDDMGRRRTRKESLPLNLFLKYQHERVPPIPVQPADVPNEAVKMWLNDARQSFEQECTTTLQCKSVTAELNQKVFHLAACCSTIVRAMLCDSRRIEMEYEKLNGFEDTLNLIAQLYSAWEEIRNEVLEDEVGKIVAKVESPTSEMDLRATITAITSLALRHEELIDVFIRADLVSALLILCEKCEGSSLRSLILRTLATMCCNSAAVRQFERFSGIQLITETLEEDFRPEPERAEAIALLVQVTAPWLDDNQSIKGLKECSYRLVKALTRFSKDTKCCQNLLLCTAALANLSAMDPEAAKYMVRYHTILHLVECVKTKVSVYLLEQVATLVANISSSELARKHLIELRTPSLLLQFLRVQYEEDATKRLQQKSVIALSRLCGTKEGAEQVVDCGGVDKLVKLCRERKERFDSDAVLVAALATLRKVADACGTEVLNAQDAQELVQPKLLDSFLTYSTQNESYV
nr:unnamed protein product [Callosobruchus chinensis]